LNTLHSLLSTLDLRYHLSSSDLRFSRPLLDLLMSINASVLLLEHASWMASSPDLSLAGLQDSRPLLEQDVEVARLWISGGHSDMERLLGQLQAATGKRDTALAHRIVYAWKL
jgi:hypothetical protein